jgi:hypothetical protein
MAETSRDMTVDQGPSADAGADRQVDEREETGRRAPAMFGQGGTIDIRVQADRDRQGSSDGTDDVGPGPTRLRMRPYDGLAGRVSIGPKDAIPIARIGAG